MCSAARQAYRRTIIEGLGRSIERFTAFLMDLKRAASGLRGGAFITSIRCSRGPIGWVLWLASSQNGHGDPMTAVGGVNRRKLLQGVGSAAFLSGLGLIPCADPDIFPALESARADDKPLSTFAVDGDFHRATVAAIARDLAKKPFAAIQNNVPAPLNNLNYDQYRDIRFRPELSIWAGVPSPFRLQLFHRGFYYVDPVEIAIVTDGQSKHLAYSPDLFTFGPLVPGPAPKQDIGFSGLRIHGQINKPNVFDEIAVFQGASYFRSLGKDQALGLSARGLALKTADREGEEFPSFRAFWVETPTENAERIVVHALLDSPSTSGAYRFTIRPGAWTQMDVEAVLFPRVDLTKVGLAPATSMFFFSANDRAGVDDFRPQVHDSDGLLMVNGRGERLWRPLSNPKELQISGFVDSGPRGFGLMQRNRNFTEYQDLEATYERRPSLWIEPVGDWSDGTVSLIEIPTNSEVHDNIVAYWAPSHPIPTGSEFFFAYRLSWGGDPSMSLDTAFVTSTRIGHVPASDDTTKRMFVIDYAPANGVDPNAVGLAKANIEASKGEIGHVVVQPSQRIGGWRVSFELNPKGEKLIELRGELLFDGGHKAETWIYRWTA